MTREDRWIKAMEQGDASAAEDAAQETFLKVIRFLDRYAHKGKFKLFLYRIAANTCVDLWRKERERDISLEEMVTEPVYEDPELALLLSVALAWIPTTFPYVTCFDENGELVTLLGMDALGYMRQVEAPNAGPVTTEKAKAALIHYQSVLRKYGVKETYDLPKGVYGTEILPYASLLYGIQEAFADPDTNRAPSLMDIDPEQIDDFYRILAQRNRAAMAFQQPESAAARSAGIAKFSQVTKPYEYYPAYSGDAVDYLVMLSFLIMCICAVIAAPVFTSDYETGADDILRCTKYGKAKFALTKITAALIISGTTMALCGCLYILVSDSLFGWESTKTSMQILYSITNLLDMNVLELQLFTVITALLSILATVSLLLFLSSKCRKTLVAVTASVVVCIAPSIIYLALPSGIREWGYFLLPSSGTGLQTSILYEALNYFYITAGNFAVWLPHAMIAVCVIEIPLFIGLTVNSYIRHRV